MAKRKTTTKPIKAKSNSIAAYTMYGLDWLRGDVRVFWAGAGWRRGYVMPASAAQTVKLKHEA